MRWPDKSNRVGDVRVVQGFLFIPKCIQDEWRWLEYAKWREICDADVGWRSVCWLERL